MKKSKLRKSKLLLLLGICVFVILTGCQSQSTNIDVDADADESVFPVEVETVSQGVLDAAKVIVGEISASSQVNVAPKVAARIESIKVKKGDQVKAGQTLATLEQTDYLNSVKQAEVSLLSAKASLENAKSNHEYNITQAQQNVDNAKLSLENAVIGNRNAVTAYNDANTNLERMTALYEANAISKKDLEQVESAFNQAKAGVEQSEIAIKQAKASIEAAEKALNQAKRTEGIKVAEASVEQAQLAVDLSKQQLSNTVITAPSNGEITAINLEVGEMASQQAVFFQIVQTKPMIVKAKLSEEALKNFNVGDSVVVTVKAVNEQTNGVVRYISSVTEPQTKAYSMEIELADAAEVLRPGMIAEVVANVINAEEVILVPIKALILDGDAYHVYVAEDQRAVKRHVELGRENNQFVEIRSGVSVGEQIIVKGHLTINEGVLIQVVGGQ